MLPANRVPDDIVVLSHGRTKKILRAMISGQTVVTQLQGKFISGDSDNLASFIPESFHSPRSSVSELVVLASYAVRRASDLNREAVRGLDIAVYRDSTESFEFLDAKTYWELADKLHNDISDAVKRLAPTRLVVAGE